jgi:hypothetical protein
MKHLTTFLLVLLYNSLLAQESKFRVISEIKTSDSLTLQTGELMIFNNTLGPICLKVSTIFGRRILSTDTIRLYASNLGNGCFYYDLVSQEDVEDMEKDGWYDLPHYPLILNPRTCFVTTISLLRNLQCKDAWINFSYLNQADIDYCELAKKYERHGVWDADPKLKYLSGRVYFNSSLNFKVKFD